MPAEVVEAREDGGGGGWQTGWPGPQGWESLWKAVGCPSWQVCSRPETVGARATECSPLYPSVPLFNPAHKPATSPPPRPGHTSSTASPGETDPRSLPEKHGCFQLGTSSQPHGERAPAGLPAALQRPCCRRGAGSGCGEPPRGTQQVDRGPSQSGSLTRCSVLSPAEQTWPSTHETLLTTWKIVAFTATSVLLVLLLVILARMFQTKFKAHFPTR